MAKNNPKNLYSEAELSNTANYLRIEKSLQYFADLELKRPLVAIRLWIREGVLVGRIRNTSPTNHPAGNRYEVYVPDIQRFKKKMYQQP